jgi:hypothetical protein
MDPLEEYMKLLRKLLALANNGLGETELANQIRRDMNSLWRYLEPIQHVQIDNLGLYGILKV